MLSKVKLLSCSAAQLLSEVALIFSGGFFAIPWTVAYEAPPSMEFSRQEYWSGLPLPSPGLSNLHFHKVAEWKRTRLPMQDTQEMRVRSLGQEDPLEREMATHSNNLAWEIPWTWTEEPGRLQSTESQRVGRD